MRVRSSAPSVAATDQVRAAYRVSKMTAAQMAVEVGCPHSTQIFLLLNEPVPRTDLNAARLVRLAAVLGVEGPAYEFVDPRKIAADRARFHERAARHYRKKAKP